VPAASRTAAAPGIALVTIAMQRFYQPCRPTGDPFKGS
jgi:hypothetical protein